MNLGYCLLGGTACAVALVPGLVASVPLVLLFGFVSVALASATFGAGTVVVGCAAVEVALGDALVLVVCEVAPAALDELALGDALVLVLAVSVEPQPLAITAGATSRQTAKRCSLGMPTGY
jgi:hypothetical protein